jgi:hypothetical protein
VRRREIVYFCGGGKCILSSDRALEPLQNQPRLWAFGQSKDSFTKQASRDMNNSTSYPFVVEFYCESRC